MAREHCGDGRKWEPAVEMEKVGWRKIVLAVMVAVAMPLASMPARALPPGAPVVSLTADHDSNGTYAFHAYASDTDGRIRTIEICIEDDCEQRPDPRADLGKDLLGCVEGDQADFEITRVLTEPGVYHVTAYVVTSGCPVVGADQSATASTEVVVSPPKTPIPCANDEAPSASDVGVSETSVELGGVAPISGPYPTQAHKGMLAALLRINRSGGVCGRQLSLQLVDDGYDASRGKQYIQNFIAEGKFALTGMLSPSGLEAAIKAGVIEAAGIPVVGSSGQSLDEFSDPWVYPIGTSSETFARVAVEHAYDAGARSFAVVYENVIPYPDMGAALIAAVHDATGAAPTFVRQVSITETDMGLVQREYQDACHGGCDALLLGVSPRNAVLWSQAAENRDLQPPAVESALPPQNLLDRVLESSSSHSDGTLVWTGFQPPLGGAVLEYISDVREAFPNADVNDPYLRGAYEGMMLLAIAMGRVGTDLTRSGLKAALDTQSFDLGSTGTPLTWAPDRHANHTMRAVSMVIAPSPFGWREASDWVADE